jgi:hypothetical protein
MKKILFISLLIVFFTTSFILLFGCNNQTSRKEQSSVSQKDLNEEYDIREKCGKQSEEWFKSYQQKYPGDKFTYKNHYNKKLNKCFIYTASFQSGGYQTLHFTDVNENKEYGSCVGIIGDEDDFLCKFLDKDVKSKKDWEKLVTPYMEE